MPYSEYDCDPKWVSSRDGTDTWCMQKMYYLLQKPFSPFNIKRLLNFTGYYSCLSLDKGFISISHEQTGLAILSKESQAFSLLELHDLPSQDYLSFEHPDHGLLFLFIPEDQLTAHYRRSEGDPQIPIELTGFGACFHTIKQAISRSPNKHQRFIMPIYEHGFKGYGHVVTLVIDYNATTKQLTPLIYDSIGRGTFSDIFATILKDKHESTADLTLQRYLTASFKNIVPLQRIAYDHQNRRDNYQCGLFSFRTIFEAIKDFSTRGIGQLSIPKSENVLDTDTHYLKPDHIKAIESCVNKDFFTWDQCLWGLSFCQVPPPLPKVRYADIIGKLSPIHVTTREKKSGTHKDSVLEILDAKPTKSVI